MEKTVETGAFSREKIGEFIKDYGAIIGIVIILFVFQIFDHRFLRPANIWGVCKSSAFLIMMALGMTLVMSVRGIDFSIAQVADASAVISAYLILHDVDPMLAIVITLAFGLIIGLVNAAMMAYLGIPALIGTLGAMFVIRSFELILTNGCTAAGTIYPFARNNRKVSGYWTRDCGWNTERNDYWNYCYCDYLFDKREIGIRPTHGCN